MECYSIHRWGTALFLTFCCALSALEVLKIQRCVRRPSQQLASIHSSYDNVRSVSKCGHMCLRSETMTCLAFAYERESKQCRLSDRPPITGTDMLESLIFELVGLQVDFTSTTTEELPTTTLPVPMSLPDYYFYNNHSGTCYMRYAQHFVNWNQADTTCKALGFGARLATFFTSEAIRLILDLYWASGPDCTDSHKEWMYVNIGLSRMADGELYWNRNVSEPLTYSEWWGVPPDGDGDCVHMFTWDGVYGMNDHLCDEESSYICEDVRCYWWEGLEALKIPGTEPNRASNTTNSTFLAPDFYFYNGNSETCYMRYNSRPLSWDGAKHACEDLGNGTQLATFLTSQAAQFVIDLYWEQAAVDKCEADRAWKAVNIGLRKVGGIWLWSNKLSTELAYTDQWKGADPTGDGECVNMYEWRGYYGFNDHHCRDPISYLCEDVSCYWSAESQNRNVPGRY